MLLGTFFPLVLVIGLGLLISIAVIVREIRLLTGVHKTATSKNFESPTAQRSAAKNRGTYKPHEQGMPEEQQSAKDSETNKAEILERESDNEWLSEIANKLDPASPEDVELLDTARAMLKHANYTILHSSEQPERLRHIQGQQQKELSKRFIERKLVELKSAK